MQHRPADSSTEVSGSFKVVSAFCDGEEVDDFAEGIGDCIKAAGGALSQKCL